MDYGHGIDTAGRPYGGAVAAAGYGYIFRYLSDGGSSIPEKQLLADEAQSYLAAGVRLVSNWETTADRMLGGYAAGNYDSHAAWDYHTSIGGPEDATIYFSADFDATPAHQAPINAYLQACIDNYGLDRVGIYGGYYPCLRAQQKFPGIKVWQTVAWSGGMETDCVAYQLAGTVWVNGRGCDRNIINHPGEVGAWNEERMTKEEIQNAILTTPIKSAVDGHTYDLGYVLGAIDFNANLLGAARTPSLVDPTKKLSLQQLLQSVDLHTYGLSDKIDELINAIKNVGGSK